MMTYKQRLDVFEASGIPFDPNAEIMPGDSYLAVRNTGVKLLTCKEVDPRGWIVPTVSDCYSYDVVECVRVVW